MFEPQLLDFSAASGQDGQQELLNLKGATVVVDVTDFTGVRIAAKTLAEDFGRVTNEGALALLEKDSTRPSLAGSVAIIIGSITSSNSIQVLNDAGQIDVEPIRGKWESFYTTVVDNPVCIDGCQKAFVIAGSDKRGTIFGVYTVSAQIGVSPWHWWADVSPQFRENIYALPVPNWSKEPSVKFRGLFINDEAPSLTGFVLEKFGTYGKEFYEKVFELLLRLRANFMWPAMWPGYPNPGSSFFTDDPENQRLADDYGIVMSTSHHEPMQRATNEWFEHNPEGSWSWIDNREKITRFFSDGIERAEGYESYLTLGMRGEYDEEMRTDDPAGVIQDVINTQRSLIRQRYGQEDAVPQLLALYKEVQEYWDAGRLNVPDDVTLLFADDNFGSIRRLPYGAELARPGGAGIYYHFEYVGTPRSYKWINSNSLGKAWHQLHEAYRRNARQIWVFNVGDIKPMEVPLSFAMNLAWDIDSVTAASPADFLFAFAEQQFGPALSNNVALAWYEYDRLMSLRRHEHIEAETLSLLHYNEASIIVDRWQKLLRQVQTMYDSSIPENSKPAFFELVLHPVKASAIYTSLRVDLARNQLWAHQRRNSANTIARRVLDLFDADFQLSEEYHSLLGGRWNHIMRQPHYGYGDTWHAPTRDMIGGLFYVQARQDSNPLFGQMGVAVEGHAGVRPGRGNEASDLTHPSRRDLVPGVTLGPVTPYGPTSRWFELYTRGSAALNWECAAPYDWIRLSQTAGRLVPGQEDEHVLVTIDWAKVPSGLDEEVLINVRSTGGNYGRYGDDFEQIHLRVINRLIDAPFLGFVETNGYVSIPATNPRRLTGYWVLPELGRLDSGSIVADPGADEAGSLLYDVHIFEHAPSSHLELHFNMTLDLDPSDPMTYDVSVDDGTVTTHRLVPEPATRGELPSGWHQAVQDCVWVRRHALGSLAAGTHRISVYFRHSNMALEKLILDVGGLESSYLGPPSGTKVLLQPSP